HATAGDDALLHGSLRIPDGVLDAVLALLELHLGGGTRPDDGHTTGELGQALLELFAVVVGVGVLDLGADLGHATGDGVGFAGTLDDGGLVLGHHDLAGGAQDLEAHAVQLQADGLGDDLTAGEDGHVVQHRLAAVAE